MDLRDRLHERAMDATGLADFGTDDYVEGLERLLSAVAAIPGIDHAESEPRAEALALPTLIGRLHSERGWSTRPECRRTELRGPLLVTGMPRTGTTALHKLLSCDEQFQVVESWLIAAPKVRPPRAAWPQDQTYRAALERAARIPPELRSAHFTEPHEPDECLALMAQSFVTNQWGSSHRLPDYDAWALAQDMVPSFRRYADNLRLIGIDEPSRRWLLKNPSNSLCIGAFLEVFPGAMVVQTHRDPSVAMGSLVSLLTTIDGTDTDVTAAIVGREIPLWAAAMRNMDEVRAGRDASFFDVEYEQFVRDPVATARSVHHHFGLAFTPTTEDTMRQWVDANPQGKHGARRYTPADYGITPSLIEEHFGEYLDRRGRRGSA